MYGLSPLHKCAQSSVVRGSRNMEESEASHSRAS